MIAPTLFVGIGGTGSKLVARLEKRNRYSKENIGYVVFDTDANELRALKNAGFTGQVVQTSANMTVGEYLDEDTKAAEEWFPINKILNRKTLTEGAGQVRAISRLAFNATVRAGGMDPLHREIEKMYKLNGDVMKQSLRVVIIGSLAGGTGSGIMLPVALYIRNYLISTYQQYSAIIRGFFLMPEIFDKVNSDQSERNSLAANTYAALRELDAFLRKGDGSLETRYAKKLKFEIPLAGTDSYQDLNVMPYDFCFLFDKRASDNSVLDTFEDYMEQAVDSVQALSIGLTSKRNNSSEDNIVKELCRAKDSGRCNRYCGAGTSTLIYPYEDIRDYISIGWAKDVLAKEWLEIDTKYKEAKQQEKEKKKTVLILDELTRSDHYIDFVDETNQNALVNRIKQCCNVLEEGIGSWNEYIQAISDHIKNDVLPKQQDVEAEKRKCEDAIDVLKANYKDADKSHVNDIRMAFEEYKRQAYVEAAKKASAVAYDLFLSGANMSKRQPYNLENWIRSSEKTGFHPSAVRYFLYQTIRAMEIEIKNAKKIMDDTNAYFEDEFKKEAFDNPLTKKITEDIDQAHDNVADNVGALGKKKAEEVQQRFSSIYEEVIIKVEDYRLNCMKQLVLAEGKEYLEQLAINYERFFDNFRENIESMEDERDEIISKYDGVTGKTKRYICASKKCLNKISKETSNYNSAVDVPGELCDNIYLALQNLTLQTRFNAIDSESTDKGGRYFKRIFNDTVMKFWKDSVEKNYGEMLDVDIIEALFKEAEYEKGLLELDEKVKYVEGVMQEMGKLSTPFITRPMGAARRVIKSCAYHRDLNKLKGKKKTLVDKWLKDNGGEVDSDDIAAEDVSVSKYEVSFTKAIYGLRLTDFGKFAPEKKESHAPEDRQSGSYFTSYYDVVDNLHPDSRKASRICPHLDRNWHFITSLPELDKEEQKHIEKKICEAMIYGLIMNKFKYEQRTVYAEKYKYVLTFKGNEDAGALIVNDDMCDNFYELLIAMIKNAMIVRRILEDSKAEINRHLNSLRDLNDCIFIKRLRHFKIDEVDHLYAGELKSRVRSILEIPLIYARTVPMNEFDEVFASQLVTSVIDVLEDIVVIYSDSEDAEYQLAKLLVEQYELFEKNLNELKTVWIGVDKEAIVSQIKLTVSDRLYDAEFYKESEWIRGTISEEEYREYVAEKNNK